MNYIEQLGIKAKACKSDLASASSAQKNDALLEIAHILRKGVHKIIQQNEIDLDNARERNMKHTK